MQRWVEPKKNNASTDEEHLQVGRNFPPCALALVAEREQREFPREIRRSQPASEIIQQHCKPYGRERTPKDQGQRRVNSGLRPEAVVAVQMWRGFKSRRPITQRLAVENEPTRRDDGGVPGGRIPCQAGMPARRHVESDGREGVTKC